MKKCTGENCPMQLGYDFENCAAIEKCPYRTWPVTIADRIRSMTDNELAGVLCWYQLFSAWRYMPLRWFGYPQSISCGEDRNLLHGVRNVSITIWVCA